eukprot:12928152-Prorocentrum_lima.AAC.1
MRKQHPRGRPTCCAAAARADTIVHPRDSRMLNRGSTHALPLPCLGGGNQLTKRYPAHPMHWPQDPPKTRWLSGIHKGPVVLLEA